jgi:hypothetical protein
LRGCLLYKNPQRSPKLHFYRLLPFPTQAYQHAFWILNTEQDTYPWYYTIWLVFDFPLLPFYFLPSACFALVIATAVTNIGAFELYKQFIGLFENVIW